MSRVLQKKSALAGQVVGDRVKDGTVLVVSNWSSYKLAGDPCWAGEDFSALEAVILIEFDQVHVVGGRDFHAS